MTSKKLWPPVTTSALRDPQHTLQVPDIVLNRDRLCILYKGTLYKHGGVATGPAVEAF